MVGLRNLVGGIKHLERRMHHLSEIYEGIAEIVAREANSVTADYREIRRSDPGTRLISILPLPTFFIWGFHDTGEGKKSVLQWETHQKTTHYLTGRSVIEAPNLKALGGDESRVTRTQMSGHRLWILAGDVPGSSGQVRTMLADSLAPTTAIVFVGGVILDFKNRVSHGEYFKDRTIYANGIEYMVTGHGGRKIVVRFPDGDSVGRDHLRVGSSGDEGTILYRKVGELELKLPKTVGD